MKKLYLLTLLLISSMGYGLSQTVPKFKPSKDGIKPVVLIFDTSYSANTIYTKVKEWISANNKNPKGVTKIDNENALIKFSCYKEKAWRVNNRGVDYWNDLQYTLTVEIKKGRCRVSYSSEDTRYKVWYNKDGSLIKNFKESESTFEATINETLTSLYKYIKGESKKTNNDW